VSPFPENCSIRHYAALRQKCKLSHAEDPKDHFCTTTSATITSPDRLDALRKTKRPELCPTEYRGRTLTSPFDFETTNHTMMKPATSSALLEASVQRFERRKHRHSPTSPIAHITTAEQPSKSQPRLVAGASRLQDRLFADGVAPEALASVQQIVERSTQSSLRSMQAAGEKPKKPPFHFQDEFPVEKKRFSSDATQTTSQRAVEAILGYWKIKDPDARRDVGGRQQAIDRNALPSISLSYKEKRYAADDEPLCRSCADRKAKIKCRCDELCRARSSSQLHFQTTYREHMSGAQSSLS